MESWTFQGNAGDRVIINAVTTSGDLWTFIDLYPPGGGEREADTRPWGDHLDHQLQETGQYTILVQDYGFDDPGEYNISLLIVPDGDPIASGRTITGRSIIAAEIDAFQFHGNAGDRVIINAVATSGDLWTFIDLYPPGGGEREADSRPWGDHLDHQLQETGLYTFLVQDYRYDDSGEYNVTFLKIPGLVTSEDDPDGGPIVSGQTLSGSIIPSDIDAFQIYGRAGDRVIINAVATSGDLWTFIDLYPPGGGEREADSRPWGDHLDHQLQETGLYTFLVQDYRYDDSGEYTVSLTKIPADLRPGIYNQYPPDGGVIGDGPGSFSWDPVEGALGYDLYFGSELLSPLNKIGDNFQYPYLEFPPLEVGRIYYWYVRARMPDGIIESPHWWFRVGPPPFWNYDYDGDGTSDIAIFRPSSGLWAIRGVTRVYFGSDQDEPVPGDYTGDGTTDIAIFRASSGLWAIRDQDRVYFGSFGDVPVPGDYTGDGTTDIGIYRESSGLWAIRGVTRIYFGAYYDIPVPGYYDGLQSSPGIFRPSSGLWAVQGITRTYFGSGQDEPVPGDYDGNGFWSPAIFRESSGLWAVQDGDRIYFGALNDAPIPGGYLGDGVDYPGIFRPYSGLWAVRGVTRTYFGSDQDIPVTR